jgi:exopolysaccharide biosynthesis polyprenyl glycosylphosphotransferase
LTTHRPQPEAMAAVPGKDEPGQSLLHDRLMAAEHANATKSLTQVLADVRQGAAPGASRRPFGVRLPFLGWGVRAPVAEAKAPPAILGRDAVYRRTLAAADVVAAVVALVLFTRLGGDTVRPATLLVIPMIVLVGKVIGLYDREELVLRRSTLDEAPALFQLATLVAFFSWLMENLLIDGWMDHAQVLGLWLGLFVMLLVLRTVARGWSTRAVAVERCLVIGDPRACEQIRNKLLVSAGVNSAVVAQVPFVDAVSEREGVEGLTEGDALARLVAEEDIHRVILAPHSTDGEHILDLVRAVKALGLKMSVLPRMLEVVGSSVEFDDVGGVPVLGVRRFGLTRSSQLVKRSFDLLGAGLGLLAIAPLLGVIAVAVKLDSRGAVFYRQLRIGRDGRPFWMLKFRTMVTGADELKAELEALNEADGLFKIANDPRLTRVGRRLRQLSIDELPQLVNVMRGDMSLVGPRPLVVDEDRRIQGWYRRRLQLTPGMTGHWQILGSARVPLNEMVKIDYLYVANWSLWTDVKILLRTVPFVLARKGL